MGMETLLFGIVPLVGIVWEPQIKQPPLVKSKPPYVLFGYYLVPNWCSRNWPRINNLIVEIGMVGQDRVVYCGWEQPTYRDSPWAGALAAIGPWMIIINSGLTCLINGEFECFD